MAHLPLRLPMQETTRLSHMILRHWRIHRPRMVAQLEKAQMLGEAVSRTEQRSMDLFYELLHVRKMQYSQAWELAMEDWMAPEETPSSWMTNENRPVTSG